LAKQSTERIVRPRANCEKLKEAIEQARKDLDAMATSRLRKDGQWRHGPMIWQTLLEVSLETASNGSAPEISKHQLTVALKRRSGLDLELDAKVWGRFQSFHEDQVRGRLRLAAAASELPALAAERSTKNGSNGGAPNKTQAVYWLCLDTDPQPEELRPSEAHPQAQDQHAMPDAATEVSTSIGHAAIATEVPIEPEAETQGPLQTPALASVGNAGDQLARELGAMASWPHASSAYLLWLAAPRARAVRSTSSLVTAVFAVVLLIPVLSREAAESLQAVQALADSISAIVDLFNGSMTVRT
jgi:hypothetical protein